MLVAIGLFVIVAAFASLVVKFLPFIVGWAKAGELQLGGVMLVWTGCIVALVASGVAVAKRMQQDNQGPNPTVARSTPSGRSSRPSITVGSSTPAGGQSSNQKDKRPYVTLSNGAYVPVRPLGGMFEYAVSVDYAFDPQRTPDQTGYRWVIEHDYGRAEMTVWEVGQGTLQGSFNVLPRAGKRCKQSRIRHEMLD